MQATTRDKCTDPDRAPRVFAVKGGRRTVGKLELPASDVAVLEERSNRFKPIRFVCIGCSARLGQNLYFDRAISLVWHLEEQHRSRGMRVPEEAMQALVIQALYDEGFEGEVS